MGKTVMRSKKKETSETKEMTNCTNVETAEWEDNLKLRVENKKKKNKINHMVLDDATVKGEGYGYLETDNQPGKVEKKNKKTSVYSEEVTEWSDAVPPNEANGMDLKKEDEKMKNKKKHKVHGDLMLDGTQDEAPKKEKTHMRRLETGDNKDSLNEKTETEAKAKRIVTDDVGKGKSNELEQRTEKKKQNVKHQVVKGVVEDGRNVFSTKTLRGLKTVNEEVSGSCEKLDITGTENTRENDRRNKNRKRIREGEYNNLKGKKNSRDGEKFENFLIDCNRVAVETRKKRKIKDKDGQINRAQNTEATNGKKRTRKKNKSVENDSENPKPKEKIKNVRFSDCIEVFPTSDLKKYGKIKYQKEDLIQGKRFSPEEDEIVKAAVFNYIESFDLGEKGLNMVLSCKSYPEIKHCWKVIGACLPYRPQNAVYQRAHILFEAGTRHEWTEEEFEKIRKFQEKHQGMRRNNWKALGEEVGQYRYHVKDEWRRIKLANQNKGNWSQEEYQNLFDLVNIDLQMRAFKEKKSKHGMLRENICWGEISDKLSTRSYTNCCLKWYKQLSSSLVSEGKWADSDDYRLLYVLVNLDACCREDVDWDNLIDHRSGDVCRKRWDQMVLHIGLHENKSFAQQVEVLAKRYCPELLEAREAWENKPLVP